MWLCFIFTNGHCLPVYILVDTIVQCWRLQKWNQSKKYGVFLSISCWTQDSQRITKRQKLKTYRIIQNNNTVYTNAIFIMLHQVFGLANHSQLKGQKNIIVEMVDFFISAAWLDIMIVGDKLWVDVR